MHSSMRRPSGRARRPAVQRWTHDQHAAAPLVVTVAGVTIAASGLLAWFLAGVILVAIGGTDFVTPVVQAIGWLVIIGVLAILGAAAYDKFGGAA